MDDATAVPPVPVSAAVSTVGWPRRLPLILLGYLPLLHIAAVVSFLALPGRSWAARIGLALATLYLAPPLAARLARLALPIREGRIAPGSRAFFGWWTLLQLQAVFCRLTFLDELLRLVPGLYSTWLRLWGARVGRLTYWSAGVTILDRSFLEVGDDVVLGTGVRLNAHVLARDAQGQLELLLATIRIGDRATVGGYSLLAAGSEIGADEATRACLILPPFSRLRDGRREHD